MTGSRSSWCFAIFVVLLISNHLLAGDSKPTVDSVASKLSCYCGTCPHLVVTKCGCSLADQIKGEVQKKIDAGMTESQIIDSFVAEFGQTVLAAPPKSGFNLTAWSIPFLAFILGGAVLFAFLKNQKKNGSQDGPPVSPRPRNEEDSYRAKLLEELENRK